MTLRLPRRRGADTSQLRAAASGSPGAFGAFYEEHAQAVLVFFTRRVLDVDTALDLMSETFAVALERCDQFRGATRGEDLAWLYAIARSQLSHYWRDGAVERRALQRLGLEPASLSDPELERLERLAGLSNLLPALNGAMDGLPLEQRDAVCLRVVDELDYPRVAERLGVSEQTARARVSRGLRQLARHLELPESVGDPR